MAMTEPGDTAFRSEGIERQGANDQGVGSRGGRKRGGQVASVSQQAFSAEGLAGAVRRLRDPLLLFAVPVVFAPLVALSGHDALSPIGFDFRGTLWEPARALLDGSPIYPEPTREAVVVGNPAVYPPLFIVASVPLALLPVTAAAWLWLVLLALCVIASMRIVGVRDWRCLVLAVTSPVVLHGLSYGNLTVLLLLPLAIAWRCRERTRVAGLAVGVAIAAKLFAWPLFVWLLLTRRFGAAAWALGSAALLVLLPWALIGFEGLADYPALLRVLQDVYATRSFSLSTAAGGLGASRSVAVAIAAAAGIGCLCLAACLARQPDRDRRIFAVLVAACILATPIVWPNYASLLFVPIAITWPRLGPAWFFGYAIWLVGALAPNGEAVDVCCRPPGVSEEAWLWSHGEPTPWFALGITAAVVGVAAAVIATRSADRRFTHDP
jgi:alpha-1,2-mannosyltransferase